MDDNIVWLNGKPDGPLDNSIQTMVDYVTEENPEQIIMVSVKNSRISRVLANGIETATVIGILELAKGILMQSVLLDYDDETDYDEDEDVDDED